MKKSTNHDIFLMLAAVLKVSLRDISLHQGITLNANYTLLTEAYSTFKYIIRYYIC